MNNSTMNKANGCNGLSNVNCQSCLQLEFSLEDVLSTTYSNGSISGVSTDVSIDGNLAIIDGTLQWSDGTSWHAFSPYSNAKISIYEECCEGLVVTVCPKNSKVNMVIGQTVVQPCMNQDILSGESGVLQLTKGTNYNFPLNGYCFDCCC